MQCLAGPASRITVAEPPRIFTGFLRSHENRVVASLTAQRSPSAPRDRYRRIVGLLTPAEIESRLHELDGWTYDGSALLKRFAFDDFAAAIGFMASARPAIDELDHHPEWTNVYNRVDVRLNSHDVGGVTERDFTLAGVLDNFSKP
jgi:4a-hydroxytetrahydrobiopterin dehydratase